MESEGEDARETEMSVHVHFVSIVCDVYTVAKTSPNLIFHQIEVLMKISKYVLHVVNAGETS